MKTIKEIALNLLIGVLIVLFILHPGLILLAFGLPGTFHELWMCGAFCEGILFGIIATVYSLGKAAREAISEVNDKKGKKK